MKELILKHKLFFGTIIFLVLLVIPLTVFQVQQQQELRQRAEGGEVTLSLSSLTEPKYPNDTFYVNVALKNPSGRDISAVEFTLSSNNNNIKIVEFEPSSYQGYTNETTDSSLQFTGLNTSESEIRSESIPLGKLTLQALATGDSKLSFSNITVTASLSPDPLSTSSQDGSYSIPAQTASTPASCGGIECPSGFSCDRSNPSDPSCVSSTPSSTITPAATAIPAPTPIVCSSLSNNGRPNVCSDNSGKCLLEDYSRYGFTEAIGVVGSIYGTNCTSTATPSKVCCYYAPPTATADAPTPTSTQIAVAPTATPVPTSTPAPTATPIPAGTTSVAFKIALLEIADNPKRENRKLKIEILDPLDSNKKIADLTDKNISNDKQVKQFKGTHALDTSFKSGIYNIKVKTDGYLRKLIPAVQITKGVQNDIVLATLTPGDINGDNRIDLLDYNIIQECNDSNLTLSPRANEHAANCKKFTDQGINLANTDLDDNGVVDGIDFNTFIKGLSVREGD